ncbi:MAG: VCBS domain-containing protein [Mesorhizobium sp.]|nr:VCBS domain-containing protein [Mesorhizobium sp.]MBL8575750.1 VCBS domain-containing protein [Mesorhizobium sp.]
MAAQGAIGDGSSVAPVSLWKGSDGSVQIADAEALFLGDYSRQGHDLVIEHDGKTLFVEDYFSGQAGNLVGPTGAFLTPDVVDALAGPMAPGQYAQAGDAAAAALVQIGKVVSLDGSASATHSDGVTVTLANGDPVYQGDVVQTGEGSKLGISFIDDTVFSMSASARMVLNELVFDPAKAADSSMVVNLVQGSFVFVSGKVAPAGSMKVETPVATMGIRGTTPTIDIIANLGVTEFSILPDPGSGKVGNYVLMDKTTGEILGNVDSDGDKWVITSLSGEVVKLAKSNVDRMEDQEATTDIRDAISKAFGQRTDLGTNSSKKEFADGSNADQTNPDGAGDQKTDKPVTEASFQVVDPDPLVDNPPVAGDDVDTIDEDNLLGGNVIIGLRQGSGDYDPEQLAPLVVTEINGVERSFGSGGWTGMIDLPPSTATAAASGMSGDNYPGAVLQINSNGTILYDPRGSFQWLAKNETATDTFTYTVRDKYGFTDTATVTLTITGNNDAPVITSTAIERVIAESADEGGVGGGFVGDDLTGTLSFTDVDITDTNFQYVVEVAEQPGGGAITHPFLSEAELQALLVVSVTDQGTTDTDGTIHWEFVGTESQFDYLAAGESVSLVYTVKVVDQYGEESNGQTITIKIVGATDNLGSNDTPVISVEVGGDPLDDDSNGKTIAETNSGLTVSGTLTVTETDRTDDIDLSVLPVVVSSESSDPAAGRPSLASLQSMLTVTPETILTDTVKTVEQFTWTFNSGSTTFDYLDENESLVLVYEIQATDGIDTDTQTVTVTITGTNDAPEISVGALDSAAKTVAETNAGLATSGTLTVVDVDLSDAVTATVETTVGKSGTVTGLGPNDATLQAMLSVTTGSIAADAGASGNLGWAFNSGSEAFDYLDDGESLILTYTVKVTDDSGATDTQTVTVTITGTNDAPVITDAQVGEIEPGYPLAATITLSLTDVDLSASTPDYSETVANVYVDVPDRVSDADALPNLVTGSVLKAAGGASGSATLAFQANATDFNLADGQQVTLIYTVEIDDGNGASAQQTFAVTVSGTAGNPVVSDVTILDGVALGMVENIVIGTTGDDSYAGDSVLEGTADADLILGLSGADDLIGGDGDDFLFGGDGDDYLVGDAGKDAYYGGDGWDMVSFRDETDGVVVDLSQGTATVAGGIVEALSGIEDIEGSIYDDELIGDAGDNFFLGGEGADSYDGGGGDWDQVSFHNENGGQGAIVNLAAGTGKDTYGNDETFANIETLRGSQWADSFTGDAGRNTFQGLAGNDTIDGGEGLDTVRYDRDERYGGDSGVTVNLAAGYAIDGFGDLDTLSNIEGAVGTKFDDTLIGSDGGNEFVGLGGDDYVDGGEGWDKVGYWEAEDGILVDMTRDSGQVINDGAGGTDTLVNIEEISGSRQDDMIVGNWQDNGYYGDDGDDLLIGGTGYEWLDGGDGDDTLDGGRGDDWMRGGAGADTFVFGPGSGQDQIDDFSLAEGDLIDLKAFGYANLASLGALIAWNGSDTVISFNAQDSLTISGINLTGAPEAFIFSGPANVVQGTNDDDLLVGTSGNDLILTDDATPDYGDDIYASLGSDTVDFSGSDDGFYNMHYWVLGDDVDIDVTITFDQATIVKDGFGTDALINLDQINGEEGGLGIYLGNGGDNVLVVDTSGVEYVKFDVGGGTDTLEVSGSGYIDVDLFWGYYGGVTVAVTGSGATAIENSDGPSSLTVTGFVNQWRGTAGDDIFNGGAGNESFITNGGHNIVDGGDGVDRVRYDRDGVTSVTVTYSAQSSAIVTGLWNGQAFTDELTSIEWIRGAREGVSQFYGSDGSQQFEARGGINYFDGGGGDDTLIAGGDGNLFSFATGSGNDTIENFEVGRDRIDVSAYGGYSNLAADIDGQGNVYTVVNLLGGNSITVWGVDLTAPEIDPADVFISNATDIVGTSANDVLFGNAAANSIAGEEGDDIIYGFAGDDALLGGIGDDQLFGGDGIDQLTGGDGADEFVFLASTSGPLEVDQILDYQAQDLINLDDLLSSGFDPDNWGAEISLVDAGGGNSLLQVGGVDVATLMGVDSTSDTVNVIFDNSEVVAISNSMV